MLYDGAHAHLAHIKSQASFLPSGKFTLKTKIAIWAIVLILIIEIMILVPSTMRYRQVFLTDLLSRAHLSFLYLQNAPNQRTDLRAINDALMHNRIWEMRISSITNPEQEPLIIGHRLDEKHTQSRLDQEYMYEEIRDLFTLLRNEYAYGVVESISSVNPNYMISVFYDRQILRSSVENFISRILLLSILVAVLTGLGLYFSLARIIVRPMRNLIDNLEKFQRDPDDPSLVLPASVRNDEIGDLERKLTNMEQQIVIAFNRQKALVALGSNVTRLSHDLRGLLTNVSLLNDQLMSTNDEKIRTQANKIDEITTRAVNICSSTMEYVRNGKITVRLEIVQLVKILKKLHNGSDIELRYLGEDQNLRLRVDEDLFFRVLFNLIRNAQDAGAKIIAFDLIDPNGDDPNGDDEFLTIAINDDGKGIADELRNEIFRPFIGDNRQTGLGLGLTIARELMQIMGGDLEIHPLNHKPPLKGACFFLSIKK